MCGAAGKGDPGGVGTGKGAERPTPKIKMQKKYHRLDGGGGGIYFHPRSPFFFFARILVTAVLLGAVRDTPHFLFSVFVSSPPDTFIASSLDSATASATPTPLFGFRLRPAAVVHQVRTTLRGRSSARRALDRRSQHHQESIFGGRLEKWS